MIFSCVSQVTVQTGQTCPLGMVLAQISPEGLVLFIAAVILVALGVAVLRTL